MRAGVVGSNGPTPRGQLGLSPTGKVQEADDWSDGTPSLMLSTANVHKVKDTEDKKTSRHNIYNQARHYPR